MVDRRSSDPYSSLVTDPELTAAKLKRGYEQQLRTAFGRDAHVSISECRTTAPRGWDYGNFTRMAIELPNGRHAEVTATLNVAAGEASGAVVIDGATLTSRAGGGRQVVESHIRAIRGFLTGGA